MKKMYFLSMYLLFIIVYLGELLPINETFFVVLTSLGMVLLLASTISMTRGFLLYVSIISLFLGHIILYAYNLDFQIWYENITNGMGIPVLFVAVPLVSIPIKYGNYLNSLESYIYIKKDKPGILFSFLAVLHVALSIALNIGAINTLQGLLEKINLPKEYLTRIYTAGYASYVSFSPYDGVVQMMILFASASYSEYFFSGLAMVFAIILVSSLLVRFDKELQVKVDERLETIESTESAKKVYELLLHIFMLIFLAFVGDHFIHFSNSLYTITLIIIIYSIFWCLTLKVTNSLKEELKDYSKNLLNFKSFLPFIIGAGFLGSMASYTPLKDYIEIVLTALNVLPLYLILQLLIILTMGLSLIGVHMMITVTALAVSVSPETIGLSNNAFALTLLTCWYMAMIISPLVPFPVVVADVIEDKPTNVTFKYNLKFAAIMLFVAPMVILLVNYFS
ncbi:hypothetical protein GGQ84_000950 [Desulfitispora alkaliphila]|uniref:hypothetical protein n=1 Tax=Desulfitispora alkaliphila TaxID=622674 RepID=UPI003D1D31C1